jgi:hypothetical protein
VLNRHPHNSGLRENHDSRTTPTVAEGGSWLTVSPLLGPSPHVHPLASEEISGLVRGGLNSSLSAIIGVAVKQKLRSLFAKKTSLTESGCCSILVRAGLEMLLQPQTVGNIFLAQGFRDSSSLPKHQLLRRVSSSGYSSILLREDLCEENAQVSGVLHNFVITSLGQQVLDESTVPLRIPVLPG